MPEVTGNKGTIYTRLDVGTRQPAGAAANFSRLSGAASGSNPRLESLGGDTNIGLNLKAKGSGELNAESPLRLTKGVNHRFVKETFDFNPVTAGIAGGAATGSTGDENVMLFPDNTFEYHILGTQTILAPVITAAGLDIASMDQVANDGIEMTQGILAGNPTAFVVGTDAAFYFAFTVKIADVSGTDDLIFGFRKVEAYQAAVDDYDEMAGLNVISGDIKIETILNDGATTTTDTTDNVADNGTLTGKVLVSAAGVVTYTIGGSAPTSTAAFTFDDAEVVIPFAYFLEDTDIAGAVELSLWEVGLQ